MMRSCAVEFGLGGLATLKKSDAGCMFPAGATARLYHSPSHYSEKNSGRGEQGQRGGERLQN